MMHFCINDMQVVGQEKLSMPLIGFALTSLPWSKDTFIIAGGVSNKVHLKTCLMYTATDGKFVTK